MHQRIQKKQIDRLSEESEDSPPKTYKDLFKTSSIKRVTICLMILWAFHHLTYFGVVFSVAVIGDEIHQNFLLLSVAEIFAWLVTSSIKQQQNQKKALTYLVTISSSCCILTYFFRIPYICYAAEVSCMNESYQVVLTMIAKFSITIFGTYIQLYSIEFYPNDLKQQGTRICKVGGSIGVISMPIILYSFKLRHSPLIAFGVFGVIAIIAVQLLYDKDDKINLTVEFETKPEKEIALINLKQDSLSDQKKPLLDI